MAEEQSHEPLIHNLQVGPGGTGVVAGTIEHFHVHPQPSSDIASLDPFATVPPLPPGFIPRPEVIEPIIQSLSASATVALTAIEGMGGVGKTIVANELCHDPRIRDTFRDGILWFMMGKQSGLTPEALTREMALHLNRELKVYSPAAYRSLFSGKSILVVLDDVWTLDAIEPFLLDSGSSRLLYTTRNREIAASLVAKNHDVDLLDDAQARRFLAHRSGWEQSPLPEPQATDILFECKGLVLGLAMIGAALKNKPTPDWARIVRNLRKACLNETGARVANYAYRTLWASIAASVEELSPEDRKRYCRLAILLEDMPCPATLLQQIWGGDVDVVGAAMNRLVDQSLASRDPEGNIHIHDFQLDFVRGEYQYPATLTLAHSALLRSLHVVRSNPEQFASQMTGRLMSKQDEPGIGELLERLKANAARTCLWPLLPALEQAGSPTRRVLEGHTDPVEAVVLTADGKRAVSVSGSNDNTFRVWDLDGRTPPRLLEDDTGWLGAVAISADGKRAVSLSGNNTLRVWDLDGQTPPRVLEGHSEGVTAVALSADGRRAVSVSNNRMRVWDLDGQTPPRLLESHADWVGAVALSADGRRAVSGSSDNMLRVWDLDGQTPPRLLRGHSKGVNAVAICADGRLAVSGSDDKTMRVWDLDGQTPTRVLKGHTAPVRAVALSPDGRYAVSGSDDNTMRVFDLDGQTPTRVLEGHTAPVGAVAISADGKRAVSGSDDKTLRVWDVDDQTPTRAPEGHTAPVGAVALSADGRRAVSVSDNRMRVWDLGGQTPPRVLKGHTAPVRAVALSADGKRAVSNSGDNKLRVWDVDGQTRPRVLEDEADWVIAIALSADGKRAVSGSDDKTLRVWDLDGQTPPRVLEGHSGWIRAVALSADGKRAVSGSDDNTLRVWDLDGQTPPRVLEDDTGWIRAVALSADGKRAVSGSDDNTLRVWDLDGQTPLRFLDGHTDRVNAVALSADGMRAVSGSRDNTLRVWDLNRVACDAVFTCDASVLSCSWRGEHVVAGDQGGRVHFFRWLE
jgi:WD40 repeat protein